MKNEKKELKYMKKLNNKGFTLVELLAVIVILAIIMVITIPTVLNSMGSAKQEAFDTAVLTVQDYMKKQIEACSLGNYDLAKYEKSIFDDGTCTLKDATAANNNVGGVLIIEKAGYKDQIAKIKYNRVTGEIGNATAGSKEFKDSANYNTVTNGSTPGYYNVAY